MSRRIALLVLWVSTSAAGAALGSEPSVWSAYLDYAYVYSSADPADLQARLEEYGGEAGISLNDHLAGQLERNPESEALDEGSIRRIAIAHLLEYLSTGEPNAIDAAAEAIDGLAGRLERHENRYWYHYLRAHRALERGRRFDFAGEVLDLWLGVIVPLESPYESLRTLSLSESPNSGFVAALPYLYENVSRLILLRSQRMGLDRGLDPLAAIVRLLHDGRVGRHPDVIPTDASSRDYLDRIVRRLNGPESDAGSLTFTLALFEASKHHDRARGLLATNGFSDETIEAIRMASGAYETALNRADTIQGQCAVYTRVLRQLGEVYAAKQRLGVEPEIETPFSIEGAIKVYASLHRAGESGWAEMGYASNGYRSYVDAMHGLWEEIQETSLNGADYYLSRSLESPHLAEEHGRNAARLYARYLSFFREFATSEGREFVPDSAYFAAYEAARGFGDAYHSDVSVRPSAAELELATRRYLEALALFPFDRELWTTLTGALERHGRENEYLGLVRPIAERVTRSRSVDTWIEQSEVGAEQIAVFRRALSDSLVILYLGFGEATGIEELEQGVVELRDERVQVERLLAELSRRRDSFGRTDEYPASIDQLPDVSSGPEDAVAPVDLSALNREIDDAKTRLVTIDKQIAARQRALPIYKAALGAGSPSVELRGQRDHPEHVLLRRMYHESRT